MEKNFCYDIYGNILSSLLSVEITMFYTCSRNLWKILLQILLKFSVGMFTDLTGLYINCLTFWDEWSKNVCEVVVAVVDVKLSVCMTSHGF